MSPLKAVPQHPRRWRSFEEWVGSRNSAFALFGIALAAFALESVFLPAYPGRDMSRYLQTFFQLGYDVPVYPAVLNTRGPLSAIGVGVPLAISGWAAELWLALLYACSIVAWARVALTFGSSAAIRHECAPARLSGLRNPFPPAGQRLPLCGRVRGLGACW